MIPSVLKKSMVVCILLAGALSIRVSAEPCASQPVKCCGAEEINNGNMIIPVCSMPCCGKSAGKDGAYKPDAAFPAGIFSGCWLCNGNIFISAPEASKIVEKSLSKYNLVVLGDIFFNANGPPGIDILLSCNSKPHNNQRVYIILKTLII